MAPRFRPTVVVFHAPCSDGFTAAWAVWRHFRDQVIYYPAQNERDRDNLPLWLDRVRGQNVLIVDFSFPRNMLETLHAAAMNLWVIDHHASAQDELAGLPYTTFDMEKSGALLTWQELSDQPAPRLVEYVSDNDLWRHQLPFSREIAAYLKHQTKEFTRWDELCTLLEDPPTELVIAGKSILDYCRHISLELAEKALQWQVADRPVMAVNAPSYLANDVCQAMYEVYTGPVSAYEVLGDVVKFSLRSTGEVAVHRLAEQLGGGGHKNSAGFTVPIADVDWIHRTVAAR